MKKELIFLFLLICFAPIFSSCLNDLNTEPLTHNNLLSEEVWKDSDAYEQVLEKIYAGLALSGNEGPFGLPDVTADDQGEATFVRSYWNLQELGTDEVIGDEDNETKRGLYFDQWNSSNNIVELNYTRIYLNIAYANEYLRQTADDKLNERGTSSSLRSRIQGYRAEARALRAMNYYFLMDLYGNIPFIDETFPVGSRNVEQKDRKFFFSWIEAELKSAEGKLPPADKSHYGTINDPTIYMLLSKMYLNAELYIGEKKYDQCLTYLNKILDFDYKLDPIYKNLFCADNYKSKEIIFPIVYDGRKATTFGGTTFLIAAALRSDMNPLFTSGFSQAWSSIRAKETLSSLFTNEDKRALFWKDNRSKDNGIWYDFTKGWSVIKYTNLNSDGSVGSNTSSADTDFPLFRLADVYLMYAEAVLRGGQGGNRIHALDYVNALRERAGITDITDSDLNLDFILDERARELYWEGQRRIDLIRFGKFTSNYKWPWKGGIFSGMINIDSKYSIYPIPVTELNANPNLKQNFGY